MTPESLPSILARLKDLESKATAPTPPLPNLESRQVHNRIVSDHCASVIDARMKLWKEYDKNLILVLKALDRAIDLIGYAGFGEAEDHPYNVWLKKYGVEFKERKSGE